MQTYVASSAQASYLSQARVASPVEIALLDGVQHIAQDYYLLCYIFDINNNHNLYFAATRPIQ